MVTRGLIETSDIDSFHEKLSFRLLNQLESSSINEVRHVSNKLPTMKEIAFILKFGPPLETKEHLTYKILIDYYIEK